MCRRPLNTIIDTSILKICTVINQGNILCQKNTKEKPEVIEEMEITFLNRRIFFHFQSYLACLIFRQRIGGMYWYTQIKRYTSHIRHDFNIFILSKGNKFRYVFRVIWNTWSDHIITVKRDVALLTQNGCL